MVGGCPIKWGAGGGTQRPFEVAVTTALTSSIVGCVCGGPDAFAVIQKKLIKIFQNDPLYKDVIIATNAKEARKALDILKSIRGPNAITLLKKHSKKLMGSDY